jgi:hypothetical protein
MLGNTGDATAAAPVQALLRDGCVLIQAFGFQQRLFRWRAAERRHPTGRERTGSPTSQTLQEPIVPLPLVCIRRGRFSSEGSSNLFPGLRKDFWIIMGTPPKGDALCSSARADHSGMPPPLWSSTPRWIHERRTLCPQGSRHRCGARKCLVRGCAAARGAVLEGLFLPVADPQHVYASRGTSKSRYVVLALRQSALAATNCSASTLPPFVWGRRWGSPRPRSRCRTTSRTTCFP